MSAKFQLSTLPRKLKFGRLIDGTLKPIFCLITDWMTGIQSLAEEKGFFL
jgi:hypothetical protein